MFTGDLRPEVAKLDGILDVTLQQLEDGLRTAARIERKFEPLPATLGSLESVAYLTAWIIAREEFIALWLAFKVAAAWKTEDRARYSMVLISMLLNVMFALAAFGLMRAEGIIN